MDQWREEVRESAKAQESRNMNDDLRIVLVGKTGGGRSATGNTILGEKKLESKASLKAVTQTCRREVRAEKWEGKQVVIVDTPAIFDACLPEQQNKAEIRKCLSLCAPGPHALVFVTQAGRFTEEDAVAAKRVEEVFGPEATKYMIVLFTRKEDLETESLEEYIGQSGNRVLQDLVAKCQGRCCAYNNRGTRDEQEMEVKELLVKIKQMMMDNQNKPFLERSAAEMKPEEEPMDTGEEEPKKFPKAEPGNVSLSRKDSQLRVVLVGKPGGGRSATGNTLLGEKTFECKLSPKPVTQTCRREVRAEKWKGKQVVVIDTPAIFDVLQKQDDILEVHKCLSLCDPGPHALVFVTQAGRFTEEDAVAAKRVGEVFGPEATKHMVVLFTRKEDLETENLEEYIKLSGNRPLQDLVRKCKGHCCAFNNRGTGEERASQAEELLSLIKKVVQENGEQPYLKPQPMETSLRSDGRNPGEISGGEPAEEKMNTGEIAKGQKKKKKSKHRVVEVGCKE